MITINKQVVIAIHTDLCIYPLFLYVQKLSIIVFRVFWTFLYTFQNVYMNLRLLVYMYFFYIHLKYIQGGSKNQEI